MHKSTHLKVTENTKRASRIGPPKKRANRRPRNWNRTLRSVALVLVLGIVGALLFWNPYLYVTRVRVDGVQTLTAPQVFAEARVPPRTSLLWMLRQPLARRLAQDPVIDHTERSIRWPNLLVLTVTERQPRAVLAAGKQFWLLDKKGVPYRELTSPQPGVPIVQVSPKVMPGALALGKPLGAVWLPDAYCLLALAGASRELGGLKITVDQNGNLCLNRKDNLQIRLGQPDSLPQKVALADLTLAADGGALARQAAYIDVSSLQQPVYKPRRDIKDNDGSQSRPN